jgi:hypothetical protein
LDRRERLGEHDAVWDAFGRPILGILAAHVNDGKTRVDLSGDASNPPTVNRPSKLMSVTKAR